MQQLQLLRLTNERIHKMHLMFNYALTVWLTGYEPYYVLKLWDPLKLYDGGLGLRLNNDLLNQGEEKQKHR